MKHKKRTAYYDYHMSSIEGAREAVLHSSRKIAYPKPRKNLSFSLIAIPCVALVILASMLIFHYFDTPIHVTSDSPPTMAQLNEPLEDEPIGAAMARVGAISQGDKAGFVSSQADDPYEPDNDDAAAGVYPDADKVIALTFDDGPHGRNTARILDALEKNDAVATFFVVGSRVAKRAGLVKRAYDEGNEIGNHTYNHADITALTYERAMNEIQSTSDAVEAACGHPTTLVRPPKGKMTKYLAQRLDTQMVMWSLDTDDYNVQDADKLTKFVMDNVKDRSIILFHDLYDSSAQAVEQLLPKLKAEGYRFVTVSELMQIRKDEGETIGLIFSSKH